MFATLEPKSKEKEREGEGSSGGSGTLQIFSETAAEPVADEEIVRRKVAAGAPRSPGIPAWVRAMLHRDPLEVGDPDDPEEAAADRAADTLEDGGSVAARSSSARHHASRPGGGEGVRPDLRAHFERGFGRDLDGVRVHTDPDAAAASHALGADAFTVGGDVFFARGAYQPDSSQGRRLIGHELAHVAQQGPATARAPQPVRRQPASSTATQDPAQQTFNFGDEDVEQRLASSPSSGVALHPDTKPSPGTQEKLAASKDQNAREKNPKGGPEPQDKKKGAPEGKDARKGRPPAGPAGPPEATVPATAGPGGEYESMVDRQVAAFLDGNLDNSHLDALSPGSVALLQSAQQLSERNVVEPGNQQGQTGPGAPVAQPAPNPYAQEEPWLRTVAAIRDGLSTVGGVVGTIGLICTGLGLILSLLIPPVGAFLLTAGRVCDVIAIIIDAITFALGIFLTGYNLYRLRKATNPEEKRRLLAMVRQDAMGTVMSGVSLALAIAPGVGKALGRTRVGRRVTAAMQKVGRWVGESSHVVARAARAPGRALSAVASAVGRRVQPLLVRARGTSFIRAANRVAGNAERRMLQGVEGLAARLGTGRAGTMYRKYARGFHMRNRRLAEAINDPIERAYQLEQGARLNQRLGQLQSAPNAAAAAAQLEQEFGIVHAPPGTTNGQFRVVGTPGSYQFERIDSALLERARQRELQELQQLMTDFPGSGPDWQRRMAERANDNPFMRGRYTPEEIGAIQGLVTGPTPITAIPKTPHHTLPANMAMQAHTDPRFWQMANDSKKYPDFMTASYGGVPEPPTPRTAAAAVPGARPGTTRRATTYSDWLQSQVQQGRYTGITDPNFFQSEDFIRQMRSQGSSGLWINPHNTTQQLLVNPHLAIGHGWNWDSDIARQIFNVGGAGEAAQRLAVGVERTFHPVGGAVGPAVVDRIWPLSGQWGSGRRETAAASTPAARPQQTAQRPAAAAQRPAAATPQPTAAPPAILAMLQDRMAQPIFSFNYAAAASVMDAPRAATPEATATAGAPGRNGPQPPPTPAPYSPAGLAQIRDMRVAIEAALEAVGAFIAAAGESQTENASARAAAETLDERHQARQQHITGEKQDIEGQQGKLTQASGAQQNMAQQGEQAKGEAGRGQHEGENVQGEGANVDVQAKPEEPDNRSWLERAWDATAGAVWRRLVAPVIRAARRKCNQVMEKINNFIMSMINQALGLDDIEREINGGGTDINQRQESLHATTGELDQTSEETEAARTRDQGTAQQAQANVEDAQAAQAEAAALFAALQTQHGILLGEEQAGVAYITGIASTYQPWFEQQKKQAETRPAGQSAESEGEPERREPAAAPGAAPEEANDRVTEAHLSGARGFLAALANSETAAGSELSVVSARSEAAVPTDRPGDVRGAGPAALATFQTTQERRRARAVALLATLDGLVGRPQSDAAPVLGGLFVEGTMLVRDLEDRRGEALAAIYEVHAGAQGGGRREEPEEEAAPAAVGVA